MFAISRKLFTAAAMMTKTTAAGTYCCDWTIVGA